MNSVRSIKNEKDASLVVCPIFDGPSFCARVLSANIVFQQIIYYLLWIYFASFLLFMYLFSNRLNENTVWILFKYSIAPHQHKFVFLGRYIHRKYVRVSCDSLLLRW